MLKNISRILIVIGGIIAAIAGVSLLVLGIVLIVCGNLPAFRNFVIDGINNGTFQTDMTGTPEEIAIYVQKSLTVLAVIFLIISVFSIASSSFSFISQGKNKQSTHILNIIFGTFSENVLSIAGSVIYLIELKNEEEV